jgi:hypothetical protein
MNKLKKLSTPFITILIFFCFILSCQNDPELLELKENNNLENSHKIVKLGKKLKNPYTVQNMRKALRKLKEKRIR